VGDAIGQRQQQGRHQHRGEGQQQRVAHHPQKGGQRDEPDDDQHTAYEHRALPEASGGAALHGPLLAPGRGRSPSCSSIVRPDTTRGHDAGKDGDLPRPGAMKCALVCAAPPDASAATRV
jgi:hypothetical protein